MYLNLEVEDPEHIITPKAKVDQFTDKIFELYREFGFYGVIHVKDSYSYEVNVEPLLEK